MLVSACLLHALRLVFHSMFYLLLLGLALRGRFSFSYVSLSLSTFVLVNNVVRGIPSNRSLRYILWIIGKEFPYLLWANPLPMSNRLFLPIFFLVFDAKGGEVELVGARGSL